MKHFAKVVVVLVLTCLLQACCPYPSSAEGAAKARALTKDQLRLLYKEMETFHKKGKLIEWGDKMSPIPERFAHVGAYYGDVGHLDRLVFGGCVDDKASLIFEGLNGYGTRRIRLMPGETIPDEVLWEDGGSTNVSPPTSSRKPNDAIKVTSVKILHSSFASGASAPYFGC
jgi:hypothetical protein